MARERRRHRRPGRREDRGRDVEAGRELVDHAPGVRTRRLHEQRHVDLLVVERRPVPPAAVLAKLLAVVAGQHDERRLLRVRARDGVDHVEAAGAVRHAADAEAAADARRAVGGEADARLVAQTNHAEPSVVFERLPMMSAQGTL